VALFIKFEEAGGEFEMALEAAIGAAAEAHVAGSGYEYCCRRYNTQLVLYRISSI
jgi:hypothetical protein